MFQTEWISVITFVGKVNYRPKLRKKKDGSRHELVHLFVATRRCWARRNDLLCNKLLRLQKIRLSLKLRGTFWHVMGCWNVPSWPTVLTIDMLVTVTWEKLKFCFVGQWSNYRLGKLKSFRKYSHLLLNKFCKTAFVWWEQRIVNAPRRLSTWLVIHINSELCG